MRQPISGDAESRYDLLTLDEDSQINGREPIYFFSRQLLEDLILRGEIVPSNDMHSDP